MVNTIHAGCRIEAQQDLAAQIAAVRWATQVLFEEASKGERGALRGLTPWETGSLPKMLKARTESREQARR